MKKSLTNNKAFIQLFLWSISFLIVLSSCNTNPSKSTPTPTEDFLSVSELFAEGTEQSASGVADEKPTATVTPTQIAPDELLASWGSSENLDFLHQDIPSRFSDCQPPLSGDGTPVLACCGCHQLDATNPVAPPDDEVCLTCHGGTHGGLGDLTRDYQPFNPHDYHYTLDVGCVMCHVVHKPLEEPCALCHANKEVYRR